MAGVVLLATMVVAEIQRQGTRRERELLFEARAGQVQQAILGAVDARGERFSSGIDFVAATHPGPADQFREFFGRQNERIAVGREFEAIDPGVIFIEEIPSGGLDGLVAREEALGNTDFQLRGITGPGRRYVVTRTGAAPGPDQVPLLGLDITVFRALLPESLPDNGFALRVMETGPALTFISQSLTTTGEAPATSHSELARARSVANDTFAVLLGRVGGDDRATGYAARFILLDDILGTVDDGLLEHLNLSVLVEGIDEPVLELRSDHDEHGDEVLRATHELTVGDQRWAVETWSDSDFGLSTSLFDHRTTWVSGLVVTFLAAAVALGRSWQHQKLSQARFELAHARTLASTDGLTGLLNRAGVMSRAGGFEPSTPGAMFFVDLDGFKLVNDHDGHEAGDAVLREVASRLRSIVRSSDLLGRLGGDEFVVYANGTDDQGVLGRMADRMVTAVGEIDHRVACSVGVAVRRRGQRVLVDELLRRADVAMYEAKRNGGNCARITVDGAIPDSIDAALG